MSDKVRQEVIASATTVVIKVGTRVLSDELGRLDRPRIESIAEDVVALVRAGRRVVLVSSGAVGAGMGELDFSKRPTDLGQLQAVAAVGQARLIDEYNRTFRRHGLHAGQILLTAEDLDVRARYLNVRNTLLALLSMNCIPVINENDTVAVDELETTFGDNDRLAALVTAALDAPLLVILSDVEGLFDGDPDFPASRLIRLVEQVDEQHQGLVRSASGGVGKGGMASKLKAAQMITSIGGSMLIAGGRLPHVVARVFANEPLGTFFRQTGRRVSGRKRWLGLSATAKGKLVIDAGAERAVRDDGRSLLAIGVKEIRGEFDKGDVVELENEQGQAIGRGLCNYDALEMMRIRGLKSNQIVEALGHIPYEEVIHRDNLAISIATDPSSSESSSSESSSSMPT